MLLETIETNIYNIRGTKVMLDSDLASLYEVETKNLNKAVKRNIERFPSDFMFQLTKLELEELRFQIGTAKFNMTRTTPFVFTQNGIAMLSSVLRSSISVQVNIQIMRTFTKMQEFALGYKDVVQKLQELEQTIRIDQQQINYNTNKIDDAFVLLKEILNDTTKTSNNKIGFNLNK